ncbi:MAG: hypothetical protein ACRDD7_06025 [Peptostreptococcaceae bacterium]
MDVLILLNEEKFEKLRNPTDINFELDSTMGLPFLENTFKVENFQASRDKIVFEQNNIRYIIIKRKNTAISDSLRGYKSNMMYIDKDLEFTGYMRGLACNMNICNHIKWKNENCFTNKSDIRSEDFIKWI